MEAIIHQFDKRKSWLFWTILGLLLSCVFSFSDFLIGYPYKPGVTVPLGLFTSYTWALVQRPVGYMGRRLPILSGPVVRNALIHVPFSILFAALLVVVSVVVYRGAQILLGEDLHPWNRTFRGFGNYLLFPQLLFYWVIVFAHNALHYFKRYREEELRTLAVQKQLGQARLQALRTQIRPHFLFNTFHAIGTLIRIKENQAALETLIQLGELLRFSLETDHQHLVPLKEEISFLRTYVGIEQQRFGERLDFVLEQGPDLDDVLVPQCLLQPLVENAVRHGLEEDPDAGRILVKLFQSEDKLECTISSDGPGLPVDWSWETHARVGLNNTRERLQVLYGDEGRFCIANGQQGGVEVRLSFPLNRETQHED